MIYSTFSSPLGEHRVIADELGVRQITCVPQDGVSTPDHTCKRDDEALREVCDQLRAYFAGELRTFTFNINPQGTPFQQQVWASLREIPYAQTMTYAEIARSIANPSACRAVGNANRANPLPFVVPCHRVIGEGGSLTGYALGLEAKQLLLDLERAHCEPEAASLFSAQA